MRTWTRVATVICLVLAVAACKSPLDTSAPAAAVTPGAKVSVPNVVGQRLPAAKDKLAALGLTHVDAADGTGRDRAVVDDANWVVTGQTPTAGTSVPAGAAVTLQVGRPTDGYHPGPLHVGTVPRVVCMNLQDAQDALRKSGFLNLRSTDGSGQGRFQVLDRDWLVTAESVRAGSTPGLLTRIVLTVVKYGEPTGASGCPS